jgi:hypothetical protein
MVNFLIVAGVAVVLSVLLLMYLDGYWTHARAVERLRIRALHAQLRHYKQSMRRMEKNVRRWK